MNPPVACDDVEDRLDELALGAVSEPERSQLLRHAAGCARCGAALGEMTRTVDELLLAAPQMEPPTDFEAAVIHRIAASGTAPRGSRRHGVTRVVLVATLVVLGALVVGQWLVADGRDGGRSAEVLASGRHVGTVELVEAPRPHVLIALDGRPPEPRAETGTVRCELETADGRRVVVGSWTYDQIESTGGIWATAVDPAVTDATTMRLLDDRGEVLATARLE